MSTYRITKKGRTPARKDAADALGASDLTPGLKVTFVHLRVNLAAALYEIERSYGSMRWTLIRIVRYRIKYHIYEGSYTCEGSTQSTSSIKLVGVHLHLACFGLRHFACLLIFPLSFGAKLTCLALDIVDGAPDGESIPWKCGSCTCSPYRLRW